MLTGDDEGGHAGDPHLAELRVARLDVLAVGIGLQETVYHRTVHAETVGDIGEGFMIADIAPLFEIGVEERHRHAILALLDARPMQEPMRIERVWRALDRREVDGEPCRLGALQHRGIGLDRAVLAAELALQIVAAIHAALGHVGVELEGVPFDLERVPGSLGKRLIQKGFTDIAPRADRVGNDIKLDHEGPRKSAAGRGAGVCHWPLWVGSPHGCSPAGPCIPRDARARRRRALRGRAGRGQYRRP